MPIINSRTRNGDNIMGIVFIILLVFFIKYKKISKCTIKLNIIKLTRILITIEYFEYFYKQPFNLEIKKTDYILYGRVAF